MTQDFNILHQLLIKNRSIRRFDHSKKIPTETLKNIIELTRFCASGRNAQAIRYKIVNDETSCAQLYPQLAWAGYYSDWAGPDEGERPVAYLIQCLDTTIVSNPLCDDGLHLEAITLGATAVGISTCIIKAFNAEKVAQTLSIPSKIKPLYVVALGYAAEIARIVGMPENGDYRYFRNQYDEQCVPKRKLDDLII